MLQFLAPQKTNKHSFIKKIMFMASKESVLLNFILLNFKLDFPRFKVSLKTFFLTK